MVSKFVLLGVAIAAVEETEEEEFLSTVLAILSNSFERIEWWGKDV